MKINVDINIYIYIQNNIKITCTANHLTIIGVAVGLICLNDFPASVALASATASAATGSELTLASSSSTGKKV